MNLATSMTTLECEPAPISLAPSVARTVNSICRPSTFVTSASPLTRRPAGLAARLRTLTAVPAEALIAGSIDEVAAQFRVFEELGYTDILVRHLTNDQSRVLGSLERLEKVRSALG